MCNWFQPITDVELHMNMLLKVQIQGHSLQEELI